MQTSFEIKINRLLAAPTCELTIKGGAKDTVLRLTEHQIKLINARLERQFYIRLPKERLISYIDDASDFTQLEQVAKKYGVADICDFSDINLYGVKRMLKVVVYMLYKYPRLRTRLCFIGTLSGYKRVVQRLDRGDSSVLKEFGLEYICSEKTARDFGAQLSSMLQPMLDDETNNIAMAINAFGFFDAILFDEKDYDGYAYIKMASLLRENERNGFHPRGCHGAESVVCHEIGHMLDNLTGVGTCSEFKNFIHGYTKDEITAQLSEYAATSDEETVAEAFAEYVCSSEPRFIAAKIGEMIDKAYKSLK